MWTLNRRSINRTSEYTYVEARTLYVDWYTYSTYMRMVLVQRTWNSRLSTHVHYKRQKTWTVMSSKRKITSFFLPTDWNNKTKYKAKLTVELREKKTEIKFFHENSKKVGKRTSYITPKLVVDVIFYLVLIVLNLCTNLLLFMFPANFARMFLILRAGI